MVRNVFDFWDELSEKLKDEYREAKAKYGNNHWWKSDEAIIVIKHQIDEPYQFVYLPDYLAMLGEFLERPVCHADYSFNQATLKEEVKLAIKRSEEGIGQSEEQREELHRDYVRRIEDIVATKLSKGRARIVNLSESSSRNN